MKFGLNYIEGEEMGRGYNKVWTPAPLFSPPWEFFDPLRFLTICQFISNCEQLHNNIVVQYYSIIVKILSW